MRIGLFGRVSSVRQTAEDLRIAADHGIASFWLTQDFGADALTALAAVAADVHVTVGTAVVPTWPRHPMVLAQQALTTNVVVGGRLVLGVGPSHPSVVEPCWGIRYERPVEHVEEYLVALTAALTQRVRYRGERLTARGDLDIPEAPAPPVMLSALGPRMLEVAGRLAAGTLTWMVGPRTLTDLTVPTIREAAAAAGRPEPEVVACVPVCVTEAPDQARAAVRAALSWYDGQPAYRAAVRREGRGSATDLAVVGDESVVRRAVDDYRAAGASTLAIQPIGSEAERAATRDLVRALAAAGD